MKREGFCLSCLLWTFEQVCPKCGRRIIFKL